MSGVWEPQQLPGRRFFGFIKEKQSFGTIGRVQLNQAAKDDEVNVVSRIQVRTRG